MPQFCSNYAEWLQLAGGGAVCMPHRGSLQNMILCTPINYTTEPILSLHYT